MNEKNKKGEKNIFNIYDFIFGLKNIISEISEITNDSKKAYSVIGPHMRHCLDHIQAIIIGLKNLKKNDKYGVINYVKHRNRGSKVETDFCIFKEKANSIIEYLEENNCNLDLSKEAMVIDFVIGGVEKHIKTTFRREMYYMFQHTTHHLYIIKQLLEKQGITIKNKDLGKSEATKAFENKK